MKVIVPTKLNFLISIVAGILLFATSETEPWDSLYGWMGMAALGVVLGFLGEGNPMLWPLAIFFGEVLYGTASFVKSLFFYSGGGGQFLFSSRPDLSFAFYHSCIYRILRWHWSTQGTYQGAEHQRAKTAKFLRGD